MHPPSIPAAGGGSAAAREMRVMDANVDAQSAEQTVQKECQNSGACTSRQILWQRLLILVWCSGVVFLLVRLVVGRIGLHSIVTHSVPMRDERILSLLRELSCKLEVRKNTIILTSERCPAPFTFKIVNPAIVLPNTLHTRPEALLRTVLLHELAHIKRRDQLTRKMAWFVCCLFWCIPPTWYVYRWLLMAEEKACDALVVQQGVVSTDYAEHLMTITQITGGRMMRLGMQHAIVHKSTLEERIRGILRLNRGFKSFRPMHTFIVLLILLVCLFPLLALKPDCLCVHPKLGKSEPLETVLQGRWLNPRYEPWNNAHWHPDRCAKIIVSPWERVHYYPNVSELELNYLGKNCRYKVARSWIDWRGNRWFNIQVFYPFNYSTDYELWKVDATGLILEITWDPIWNDRDFPKRIDRRKTDYGIYYRSF
jgi:beta-lactamase regulating signal transducer with metallopeptidase domain